MRKKFLTLIFALLSVGVTAQESSTRGSRVLLMQSTQTTPKGQLLISGSYRGGVLNAGSRKLWWDLAESSLRLSLHYGISDRLEASISRNAWEEQLEGAVKWKWAAYPQLSISSYHAAFYTFTDKWQLDKRVDFQTHRFSFAHQLIIAWHSQTGIDIQFISSLVHRNIVALKDDAHDEYIPGLSISHPLGKKTDLRFEYARRLQEDETLENTYMSLGIACDYKEHELVFYLTNASGYNEVQFLSSNKNAWNKGQLHLGFLFQKRF